MGYDHGDLVSGYVMLKLTNNVAGLGCFGISDVGDKTKGPFENGKATGPTSQ